MGGSLYVSVPRLLPAGRLSGAFPVTDHLGSGVLRAGRSGVNTPSYAQWAVWDNTGCIPSEHPFPSWRPGLPVQQCIHPAVLPQTDHLLFCQNAAWADS